MVLPKADHPSTAFSLAVDFLLRDTFPASSYPRTAWNQLESDKSGLFCVSSALWVVIVAEAMVMHLNNTMAWV